MCIIPNELKIPFIQMENIFYQYIDKFLKIEEVEYLIYYIKFKMWPALFDVNSLCFPNIFECWCEAVNYFLQFTQRLKTGILNVALAWTFQFFLVGDSLVDQFMLFTHLYLMQEEKIEAWLVSSASREYFGAESTTFLSTNKFTKNLPN